MAAPLKRVCHTVARNASQCHRHCIPSNYFAASSQCQKSTWITNTQQRRHLSHTPRSSASPQRRSQGKDEATEEDFALMDEDPDQPGLPSLSDISSTGYGELEQHRELRQLARVAAWEMPLLQKHRKEFVPPNEEEMPLRWRYTTYFGEPHPATRKVVVMFKVADIKRLDDKQALHFKKLCGSRYNPETDTVRMSCDSFEEPAQNKRWLGDRIKLLMRECLSSRSDKFEGVPLDTRHHKKKVIHQFPEEWKITPDRKKALEKKRQALMLKEGESAEENQEVVSGIAAIEAARQVNLQKEEELIMAEARRPLPTGKMGRKEIGQTRPQR
ncbi:Hypothetical predicted protein [Lecanosticta acicola]|uniref:Small ribosomal subunit protein mS35 mitochondrial conserved domain-containing protein n=1 Tax=Lecanosticta acicola TaxID=111012 RepID=A0AAI8VUI5_9PEZI|nr:Hypothetical predicted protein [Lecanosticta acicola]